ncbi:MAG: hypothetical protein GPJ54_22730 [Candidatus Heimdallarchaeota archaeon]|nr:hypothetical protein [Candidatus Heimdallarchaeota archaeon]
MLEVAEVRDGNFEISDLFTDQDRKQIIFYKQLLQAFSIFLLILALIIIGQLDSLLIQILITLLFLSIIGGVVYFAIQFHLQLTEEINGFVLIYDDNLQVNTLRVRRWLKGKYSDFSEEEIRFNQAIGFQALLNENGDIQVEVIVDPNFPGSPIFKTYDFATLAEFILLFQKAMPKLDKWYYKAEDGNEWSSELTIELNQELQLARVPWLIRKYYGF